mgnify:CR=1 FL=1
MIRYIQTEECRLNQKKENGLRKNFNKKFGLFKDNNKNGGKTLLVRASPVGHSPTTLHTHEVTGSSPVVSTKKIHHPFGWCIFYPGSAGTRTHSNAICRWHIATASSKTGCILMILPMGQNQPSSPVVSTRNKSTILLDGAFCCF